MSRSEPQRAVSHPRWAKKRWLSAIFGAMLVVAAATSILSRVWPQWSMNFVSILSLLVTSAAAYLATRIFRKQTEQSAAEHREQQDSIGVVGNSASDILDNTERIIEKLDAASQLRLNRPLSEARKQAIFAGLSSSAVGPVVSPRVLWVDDDEASIECERAAFSRAGVVTVWVRDSDLALEVLNGNAFDAVISDMGRPEGDRAGYSLFEGIRKGGDPVPFFIYSGSRRPEHVAEARERGAQGATNDPGELFEIVLNEVTSTSRGLSNVDGP